LPESFHPGFKIHAVEKSQFGIYYGNGLNFSNKYSCNSLTLDHQYHFDKLSEISHRQIWFFRQGLLYGIDNSEYSKIKHFILNLSIGREFNISPKHGFLGDLGLCRSIVENETIKDPDKDPRIDFKLKDFFALPVIRLQFYYSL